MQDTGSIGAVLKQERERRKLTPQDVYESTKITVQNISALEEDRFDFFPNKVYVRAFLRDYSNYLGLDSSALLEKYEAMNSPDTGPVEPVAPVEKKQSRGLLSFVIVLLVIAAIAGGGYYAYINGYFDTNPVVSAPEDEEVLEPETDIAELPETQKITPEAEVPEDETETPDTQAEQQEAAVPVTPSGIELRIGTFDKVWVRVVSDGEKVYENILQKGDIKTISAERKINVRAGKAGAIQLRINGELQPPFGPLSRPGEKTFILQEDGNIEEIGEDYGNE